MSITTLVVIFSAPMPKSPGGVMVRASDEYLEDPGSIPEPGLRFFFMYSSNTQFYA